MLRHGDFRQLAPRLVAAALVLFAILYVLVLSHPPPADEEHGKGNRGKGQAEGGEDKHGKSGGQGGNGNDDSGGGD